MNFYEVLSQKYKVKVMSKKHSDPSLKPPKEWFDEKYKEVKEENKDYDDEKIRATVGNIWYNLIDDSKRKEIRERYGKKYGKAKKD